MTAWHLVLQDEDYDQVCFALRQVAKSQKFPPQIAELTGMLSTLRAKPEALMTADEAWNLVFRYAANPGFDGEKWVYAQLDERTAKALRAVTFYRICYTPHDQIGFVHRAFVSAYEAMAERDLTLEASHPEAKAILEQIAERTGLPSDRTAPALPAPESAREATQPPPRRLTPEEERKQIESLRPQLDAIVGYQPPPRKSPEELRAAKERLQRQARELLEQGA